MDTKKQEIASNALKLLKGKFVIITDPQQRSDMISHIVKSIEPDIDDQSLKEIESYIQDLSPITELISSDSIEDITINDTRNIFIFDSKKGFIKIDSAIRTRQDLSMFVDKLKLYATNETAKGNILDVHLPTGSRANIIATPMGENITIRNFKRRALSIIDLINYGELDYDIAARLWVYIDGFRTRPANMLLGGMPAAGKTTLLNSLFSFFRPNARIVVLEETYELDTSMHENTARLETSIDMPMVRLAKNMLRMRPDVVIIGEIRGAEANDLISVMNVGKNALSTMHASSAREMINRLELEPMNVPRTSIPIIDVLVGLAVVYKEGSQQRKVIQISETAGMESQVLLSDLYKYDYRTDRAAPILPSISYRDMITRLLGIPPSDILEEERVRALLLKKLNDTGVRDISSISQVVYDYYDNPNATLSKYGISLEAAIHI